MVLPGSVNRTYVALIVLLSLCIGMQMLGLPVSMWNPVEESDTSENLDFSIPPIILRLSGSILLAPVELIHENLRILLLPRSVFHPPNSPQ